MRTSKRYLISCNNEAVVNSQIPVDTYYIDNDARIYPTIRYKTYRKVPTEKSGELAMVKNPTDIVARPALNNEALLTLKNLARRLEEFYQGPMDVEFVVDENVKTIYVVQARPIVHSDQLPKPTFMKNIRTLSQSGALSGASIGVAGGAVRVCTKDASVVQADINKALTAYQDHVEPEKVACIIVGKLAPATSHEATSFRADVKPVMYIREWERVKDWLDEGNTLVMSPQQHIIGKWRGKVHDLDQELADGWVSYPAPPALSLPLVPEEKIVGIDKQSILALVPTLKTLWPRFTKNAVRYETKTLFDELTGENVARAEFALASLLYQMHEALAASRADVKLTPHQIIRLYSLETHALTFARAISDNLATPIDLRARMLLPVHALKTLFYQIHAPYEIVDAESVLDMSKREFLVEQELMRTLASRDVTLKHPENLHLLKLGGIALTKDLEEKWFQFVVKLDQQDDGELTQRVASLVRELGRLDLLSPWLHVAFAKDQNAMSLLDDFEDSKANLARILEYRHMVDALQVSGFGEPKSFSSQWQSLENMLNDYFLDDAISGKDSWQWGFPLERLAMLALMKRLVDKFDLSIKELKTTKNLERFRMMTRHYITLAKTWWNLRAALIPPRETDYLHQQKFLRLSRIVDRVELNNADLSFSQDFNAEHYVNGLNLFGLGNPATLEDAFSVAHQYLLKALSGLGIVAEVNQIAHPLLLEKIEKNLKIVNTTKDLSLIGCELGNGVIELFYNYPLREHSLQYSLRYDKRRADVVVLRVNYAGGNEGQRWDRLADFFGEKIATRFSVTDVKVGKHFLTFAVTLAEDSPFKLLSTAFLTAEQFSSAYSKTQLLEYLAASLFSEDAASLAQTVREGARIRPWQAGMLVSPTIMKGDAKLLEQLLTLHPELDLNAHVSADALSALTEGLPELPRIIELLVKFNLRGTKTDTKNTPFYLLVFMLGHGQLLIDAQVDVNMQLNSRGITLLHWAVVQEHGDHYVKILAQDKNLSFTHHSVYMGGQPLDRVCGAKKAAFDVTARARLLIDLGAPVKPLCLEAAMASGNHDMVTFLVKDNLIDKSWFFDGTNYTRFLEKHLLNLVQFSMLQTIIEKYLDGGNGHFASGEGLLHFAVKKSSAPLLEAILKSSTIDVDNVDKEGFTALHWAVWLAKHDFVRTLLQHGADVTRKDTDGDTVKDYEKDEEMMTIIKSAEK